MLHLPIKLNFVNHSSDLVLPKDGIQSTDIFPKHLSWVQSPPGGAQFQLTHTEEEGLHGVDQAHALRLLRGIKAVQTGV